MLDVSRVFKFKNMDVFIVSNLNDYYGIKFKNDEEFEAYNNRVNILIMDLRRPIDLKIDTELSHFEDLEDDNYIKVLVLSNYELDDKIKEDIDYFCEKMRGTLDYWFYMEFKKFEDFPGFETLYNDDDSYLDWKKAECTYFKNIAKQYGVQFEPGELTEEKLLHLSQD